MSELYELPDGWEWKKLIETIRIANKTININDNKKYNCIGLEHIESNTGKLVDFQTSDGLSIKSSKVVFEKNMVLYGKLRPYLNKVWRAEFSGIATTEILPFEPLLKILNSNYLANYLRSNFFVENAIKNTSGARMPRVTTKYLKNEVFIPLPSLQEQKRIVSKLDTLFEKIDKSIALHQKNMDEADVFMGSVLNDVFGELEEKYKKQVWSEVLKIKNGKHYKDVIDENGQYPIYGSGGIMNYANDYLCNEDTVIIGRKGTINNPLFVKEKFWNIDTAFGIEANKDVLLPMFLFYFSKYFNFLDLNKSTTLPSLAKTHLLKIIMVLPPLNIQQKVVTYLDEISQKIEKIKSVQKEKMQNLVALKASILDQAFRGEL